MVLLEGRAAATATTAAGRAVGFSTWTGPCALDKVALLDGSGHTATFAALTPCAVRAVPRARFTALLDDSATVRAHVFRLLAAQARAQQDRLTATVTLRCGARPDSRPGSWSGRRRADPSPPPCPCPAAKRELADLLGVTRATVNRALSRLRRDGLVRWAGDGRLEILAPELLALRAAAPE
ncbi:Crp/Fnr family transcriptional regulator [Streptomyces sp. NBC_01373]|nr:Crp/Fnr family transcriptional regulator [Streptomyces sp. NBC_01373]